MKNATLCYLRVDDKTLFLCRNRIPSDIHSGLYVVPGGQTERGERGIDCILREFEQETGLKLVDPKLKAIVTFYNEGRILGGNLNPEDWCVEVYTAYKFSGDLKPESPDQVPVWISNKDILKINMHEGDRKILELLDKDGVLEVIVQYDGKKLTRFEQYRVN